MKEADWALKVINHGHVAVTIRPPGRPAAPTSSVGYADTSRSAMFHDII